MKVVLSTIALAASASAFAPSTVTPSKTSTALSYAAELDDMVGTSVETGNKVVSVLLPRCL